MGGGILETLGSQKTWLHGAKSSIGATAIQLSSDTTVLSKGVLLKADNANSGTIYVGTEVVTAGTNDATDGMPLMAGDGHFLEADQLARVYVIASAPGQKIYWEAL